MAKAHHFYPTRRLTTAGFTIVELLAVIGIISILASLLLPAFSSALQRAKETQCKSNFKQIGTMTELFASDNNRRFPPRSISEWDDNQQIWVRKRTDVALGGRDPKPGHFTETYPFATNRPFYAYQGNGEVFRCPMDKGHQAFPSWPICNPYHEYAKPSMWQTIGSSYVYNAGQGAPWDPQRSPPLPLSTKLLRRPPLPRIEIEDVKQPDRHILMTEASARPMGRRTSPTTVVFFWSQWHRNRGKKDFRDPTIAPAAFWSPVLYVDGHVEFHNFSRSVMTDPHYPYEETLNWVWYESRATHTNSLTP
jgi:prepilin-type N-terminal cleavage/methylation domain-containing protein/prepilin-type processing-associated H-X9-DG protein